MKLNWRHKAGLFLTLIAAGTGLLMELSFKQSLGIAFIGVAFAWLFGSLALRILGLLCSILLLVIGFYLTAGPLWGDWKGSQESGTEYDSAISELRLAVKNSVTLDWSKSQPISQQQGRADDETIRHLAQERNFDVEGALKAGYSKDEILHYLANPQKQMGQYTLSDIDRPARFVTIPEAAKKWMRHVPDDPYAKYGGSYERQEWKVEFPGRMSETEIMRAIETSLLPRPTFSLAHSLGSHALPLLAGVALFTSGLLGGAWVLLRRGAATSEVHLG